MGNCKNKRLIGPYLDGHLGECKWLEEHIVECSECLAEYEAVQRLAHLADKADYPPPEGNYWQKFGTRVIARIAARPQPKRYPRFIESLFANKMAFRLVTPLMAVLIAVLALRIYIPLSNTPSIEPVAAIETTETSRINTVMGEMADMPILAKNQAVKQDNDTQPVVVELSEQAREIEPEQIQPAIYAVEQSLNDIESLMQDYLRNREVKVSPTRLAALDNGFWAEISQDYSFRIFDTDNVLKFQIISGSNPSLAPLSSYREAAGKFFAPEISNSRNSFEENIPNRWGYARGDDKYNKERQQHLELEFDLSREK